MEISLKIFTSFAVATSGNKVQVLSDIKANLNNAYQPEKDYYKYLRSGIIDYETGNLSLNGLQTLNQGLSDSRKVTGYQEPLNNYVTWRGQFPGNGVQVSKKQWQNGSLTVKVNPTICINDSGIKNHIFLNYLKKPISQDSINVMTTVMNEVYTRNRIDALC